jgi:selenocysteine lyase/cysteine desulfurase
MELDVNEIDPDFMIASGYKWLLCPYAFSFLYAAPRHHSAQPIEHYTWTLSDTPPLGMMRGDDMDGASGARRFDMGERNNPILPAMAIKALDQLIEWRLERISRSIEMLTDLVEAAALDRGMLVPPKHCRVAHIIGIRRHQGWPEDLQDRLASLGVYVSKRGDAMRVSPYLYNEANEVERLFEAVDHLPAA